MINKQNMINKGLISDEICQGRLKEIKKEKEKVKKNEIKTNKLILNLSCYFIIYSFSFKQFFFLFLTYSNSEKFYSLIYIIICLKIFFF